MATVFTVNYSGNYGSKYEFKADATESSVSSTNNTSVVTVKIYVRRTDSSSNGAYNNYGTDWSVTIDGTKTTGNSTWDTRNTTAWQLIGTASKTVTHNSDGSKNISIAATHTGNSASGSSQMGNASGSGSIKLTDIPRYATCIESLASKTSTSLTMNWSSDSIIDYLWYSINGGTSWKAVGSVNSSSGRYTISGLSPETTYSVTTRVRRKDSGLTTNSSTKDYTTYAKTVPKITLLKKGINSITVTSSCNVGVSSTQYRIKITSGSYGAYQTSATFSNLKPNTAYVIEVKKVASASGEAGSTTLNVTTYDIARISSATNFNLGSNASVTITNPANVTASLVMKVGGMQILSKNLSVGTNIISFTDAQLDAIYKKFMTANSVTVSYTLITSGNSSWTSTKNVTCSLTGNQKTEHINIKTSWKRAKGWVNIKGTYKRCVTWVNINGNWRRCI